MTEDTYTAREVGTAIGEMKARLAGLRDEMNAKFAGLRDEMSAKLVGLRDEMNGKFDVVNAKFDGLCGQLTLIKWVMGGFGAVSVAAFAHFHIVTRDLTVAVTRIDEHMAAVDVRLTGIDNRLDALEQRIDRKFDSLTTLILNLQLPQKRTEGLGNRQ
jgi:hypothetical protein